MMNLSTPLQKKTSNYAAEDKLEALKRSASMGNPQVTPLSESPPNPYAQKAAEYGSKLANAVTAFGNWGKENFIYREDPKNGLVVFPQGAVAQGQEAGMLRDQYGMNSPQFKEAMLKIGQNVAGMTGAPKNFGPMNPEDIPLILKLKRLQMDPKAAADFQTRNGHVIDTLAETYLGESQKTLQSLPMQNKLDLLYRKAQEDFAAGGMNSYAKNITSTSPTMTSRPPYEIAYEKALNSGDKTQAVKALQGIPSTSPYAESARRMFGVVFGNK